MNTAKRLNRVKRLLKISGEPTTDAFDYKTSLMLYFNFHNVNTPLPTIKLWAVEYLESLDIKPPNAREVEFKTLGILVRLKNKDAYIEQEDLDKIDSEVDRLSNIKTVRDEVIDEDKPDRAAILERTFQAKASEFIAEFEALIDDYYVTNSIPNVKALIATMGVSSRISPRIQEHATKQIDYYEKILSDADALGYYKENKPFLRRVMNFYVELNDQLSQTKRVMKPRKTKEKPAGVLVKSLKYQIQDDSLDIRSVSPTSIIGATELYLYRTDTRKLQYFKSLDGNVLTVKGTTVMNYDESKSFQKNIRKPEIVKEFVGKGKIDSRRIFKAIKATDAKVSGRTSDTTLIINALK